MNGRRGEREGEGGEGQGERTERMSRLWRRVSAAIVILKSASRTETVRPGPSLKLHLLRRFETFTPFEVVVSTKNGGYVSSTS